MSEGQLEMSELRSALDDLPKVVVRRANALKNIHTKFVEQYKKYQQEVRALEQKYQKETYEPLFAKRAQIVNGEYEPTEEESKATDPAFEPTNNPDGEAKGIPEFWLTVIQNSSFGASSIFEQDEEALKFLRDVKCENLPDKQHGFRLTFHFAENPFFTDSTLVKTYFLEEEDLFGELVLDKAEGSKINWKPGKNLTVKVVTQKAGGKGKGAAKGKKGSQARTVKVEEPQDSFFAFFSPPQINEEDEPGEEDEILENDFELGCLFKDKLVPFAALWFTGEAAEFEDDFGDEFDEDEFDEDEDDEEEDEEDEEEEEAPPTKKGGRGGKGGPRGGPGHSFAPPKGGDNQPQQPQQPECKQQ